MKEWLEREGNPLWYIPLVLVLDFLYHFLVSVIFSTFNFNLSPVPGASEVVQRISQSSWWVSLGLLSSAAFSEEMIFRFSVGVYNQPPFYRDAAL